MKADSEILDPRKINYKSPTITAVSTKVAIEEISATYLAFDPESAVTMAPNKGKNIKSIKSCAIMFSWTILPPS